MNDLISSSSSFNLTATNCGLQTDIQIEGKHRIICESDDRWIRSRGVFPVECFLASLAGTDHEIAVTVAKEKGISVLSLETDHCTTVEMDFSLYWTGSGNPDTIIKRILNNTTIAIETHNYDSDIIDIQQRVESSAVRQLLSDNSVSFVHGAWARKAASSSSSVCIEKNNKQHVFTPEPHSQAYLAANDIPAILDFVLNRLARERPETPLPFMENIFAEFALTRTLPHHYFTILNSAGRVRAPSDANSLFSIRGPFRLRSDIDAVKAPRPLHYLLISFVASELHLASLIAEKLGIEWGKSDIKASIFLDENFSPDRKFVASTISLLQYNVFLDTSATDEVIAKVVVEVSRRSYMRRLFDKAGVVVKVEWHRK